LIEIGVIALGIYCMSYVRKNEVKLSVIIACFNGGEILASQLGALSMQKWRKKWEVIIADNGSTDNSRQIIERFKPILPNLRIVEAKEKRGAAYARNMAIQQALGDCFAFCDADDQVGDGWVANIGEALEEFDVVVSKLDDRKLNQQWLRDLWESSADCSLQSFLGFLPAAATYGLGFTRQVYERVGVFDESLPRMSDIDYTWRIQLAGFKLQPLPDAVVYYRYRDSLGDMFIQAFLDGQAQVMLYIKYREQGMPWESWWHGIKAWMWMIRRLPQLRTRLGRGRWLVDAGFLLGRLRGSIKFGVIAL
jgi:glycosyltransferase involved in cell wall biosynthesis